MSGADRIRDAIAVLRAKVDDQEAAVRRTKETINGLCADLGDPEPYPAESLAATRAGLGAIREDEYYGQPLSTAVRMVLEARKAFSQGSASVNDIFDTLKSGGFKFEAKSMENAKRGLRISLTKNSATFHRLPNGSYGLLEWYPEAKQAKGARPGSNSDEAADTEDESAETEEGGDE